DRNYRWRLGLEFESEAGQFRCAATVSARRLSFRAWTNPSPARWKRSDISPLALRGADRKNVLSVGVRARSRTNLRGTGLSRPVFRSGAMRHSRARQKSVRPK